MADAWHLFLAMSTQWEWVGVGMAGAFQTGLKYGVLPVVAPGLNIIYPLPPQVFADLRTLEGETLKAWSEKRG